MTEESCKDCKAHSGMEESLKNMKTWAEGVTETLKHIVTAKAAWAFFVVFLSVCLAVVGFLWHGQLAAWNNINLNHKETMKAVTEIKDKVLILDFKVGQHLEETKDNKKRGDK